MLLICGSTSKGEESVLLDCFKALKNEYANLRLLIAPRHIERTAEIEKLILRHDFSAIRMSGLNLRPETLNQKAVFILDTIGELRPMYSAGDIVFVGGSLVKRGGQNPIEPASFAKPIIFGKYTYNFQDVIRMLLEKNAGIEVQDRPGLCKAIKGFLDDPEKRNQMGCNARAIVDKNSGSCQRTIAQILSNP